MSDAPEGVDEEEDAGETEDTQAESASDEGLSEGDFVRVDYTARTEEGDQLVDTTDPEVAEAEGVDDQNRDIGPRVLVLGEGHLFPSVEEDIYGSETGDTGEVVVSAEEAFGEHDPDEVRTVSADKIPEDDRYPGAHVQIDGDQGHVQSIIGGRARVDFNHPLAGQDIEYEYEVLEEVDDRIERAKGLVSTYLDLDLEMWIETDEVEEEQLVEPDDDEGGEGEDEDAEDEPSEPEYETVTVEKETLYVEATPQLTMNQQWMFSKQQIVQEIIDKLEIDRVIVQEILEGAGPLGGMGGMGGGLGGGDIEDALEDVDVDADEIVDELEEDVDE